MQIKTSDNNFALILGTYFDFKFLVMFSLYILMSPNVFYTFILLGLSSYIQWIFIFIFIFIL